MSDVVRAAGGLVRRPDPAGGWLLAVVHRPKYDDWTFPKGKCDDHESDEQAARREVHEETGLRCELGPAAGDTRYRDARDRPKVVRYWMMDPLDPEATVVPNEEVDQLRWCTVADAGTLLTYDHDRALLLHVMGDS